MATVENLDSSVPIIQCAKSSPRTVISLKFIMAVLATLKTITGKKNKIPVTVSTEMKGLFPIYCQSKSNKLVIKGIQLNRPLSKIP